jgi:uncharacterized FAD-dependent dehydrogenase
MNPSSFPALHLSDIVFSGLVLPSREKLIEKVSRRMKIEPEEIEKVVILKRSLDRRRGEKTVFTLAVFLKSAEKSRELLRKFSSRMKIRLLEKTDVCSLAPRAPGGRNLIVGAGPAGLFLAWSLVQAGREVCLIERGESVPKRLKSVGHFWARGRFNAESNVCFGEGGAGAFSDGKLVSRNRSPWKRFVLETLVSFGADESILYEASAHIGSNRLRRVVKAWREAMQNMGLEIHFENRVEDLIVDRGKVLGVKTPAGDFLADRVFWAAGSHARDSHEILAKHGVAMQAKAMAIGLRIEHPQALVNEALAGYRKGPACEYNLKTRVGSRGVYSFCMCPGGVVVASSTAPRSQVVNGMSCHGKKSPYANSALVVELGPKDYPAGVFGAFDYQRYWEEKAFEASRPFHAPAQRLTDFLADRESSTLPKSTYRPGLLSRNLRHFLPPYVYESLLAALPAFSRQLKGYVSEEALLIGLETRSSCPVTILRDAGKQATLKKLYCVGEGAGFSGGILSSAYDALNVLDFLAEREGIKISLSL